MELHSSTESLPSLFLSYLSTWRFAQSRLAEPPDDELPELEGVELEVVDAEELEELVALDEAPFLTAARHSFAVTM